MKCHFSISSTLIGSFSNVDKLGSSTNPLSTEEKQCSFPTTKLSNLPVRTATQISSKKSDGLSRMVTTAPGVVTHLMAANLEISSSKQQRWLGFR